MPYVTTAMRVAAPELCEQMDGLRKERKTAVERRCYMNTIGNNEAAAEVQQRIEALDAEVSKLHAAAKDQLLKGISTNLSQQLPCSTLSILTARRSGPPSRRRLSEMRRN